MSTDGMRLLDPGPRQIAYRLEGPRQAPVLVFSNSLGTSLAMWDAQAAALAQHFRVLRYDTRGHGASGLHGAGDGGGYRLEQLGGDVLRLLDGLDIARASFCGISMGGITGLWLGVHAGARLERLVVANSAARIGEAAGWLERAAQVRAHGMEGVADGAAGRWFTPAFRSREPAAVQALTGALRASSAQGYTACCDALAQADLRADIAAIAAPTLLIAGLHDPVTTVADARSMQSRIRDARVTELDASHISNVEAPDDFTAALRGFLE